MKSTYFNLAFGHFSYIVFVGAFSPARVGQWNALVAAQPSSLGALE